MKIRLPCLPLAILVPAWLLFAGILVSCQFFSPSGGDPGPWSYTYNPDNPCFQIDFGTASRAIVTLHGIKSKRAFIVRANASGRVIPGALDPLDPESSPGEDEVRFDSLAPESPSVARQSLAEADSFNARPALKGAPRSVSPSATPTFVSYGQPAPGYGEKMTHKWFWVKDAAGAWVQIRATLQAAGIFCYVWVADDCYWSLSNANNDNMITWEQAVALKEKFDGNALQGFNLGMFNLTTSIFGFENGGGPAGDGGRDADQHVSILVYDIDGDHAASQTGGTFGYFWGKDHYDQEQLDAEALASSTTAPRTNKAEMLYLDSHFLDRYPIEMYFTLAHEYQHMIHYARKTLRFGTGSPTWYNEMCSLLAEDIVVTSAEGGTREGFGPRTWLPIFCRHYAQAGLTEWYGGTGTSISYASAYAFGTFLARNYGGVPLIRNLISNPSVGIASINDALVATGSADSFTDAFLHYGEALVFVRNETGTPVKTLNRGMGYRIDEITNVFLNSIDLLTYRQYDVFANSWVSEWGYVGGLRFYRASDMPELRPWGLSIHKVDIPSFETNDITFAIEAPVDPDVRVTVMVSENY